MSTVGITALEQSIESILSLNRVQGLLNVTFTTELITKHIILFLEGNVINRYYTNAIDCDLFPP